MAKSRALMMSIDDKLEATGYAIFRNKYKVLAGIILMVAFLLSHLPDTTVDTSTEGFLHKTDPARVAYDKFRDQYGRDEKLVVAIASSDIFSKTTLEKLKTLHNELQEKVPYLNDITSLINARNTQGSKDSLLVEDLFEHWPKDDAALAKIKQTALDNPLYKNILISEDGTFTVIVLESNAYTSPDEIKAYKAYKTQTAERATQLAKLDKQARLNKLAEWASLDKLAESTKMDDLDVLNEFEDESTDKPEVFITDAENTDMVLEVEEILKRYQSDDFKIFFAGSPAVTAYLKSSMMKDMAKFNGLILLTIIVFLSLLFRRASGVILPLFTVILGVVSTIALMAFMGTPIKVVTQILPSLLLAVGVGASVHVLAMFYKHLDAHGNKADAIAYTLRHSGLAIIMTSLTTAAGIASFAVSKVAPVADLGMFASAGIMLILIFSLVLLPALLAIFPTKVKTLKGDGEHHDLMDKMLKWVAHISYTHAKKITFISLSFMFMMLFFATSLNYSHNPLKWFKEDYSVRVATEMIDTKMKGSISLDIIIDTKKENGLYDYALLSEMDKLAQYTLSLKNEQYFVGKALSITDVMKEIHKALNENSPEFYVLTQDKKLMAQEILLFENSGSDDLEDFVDSSFSQARITIKMPWIDAFHYHDILTKIDVYTKQHFDKDIAVTITGMIPLLADTISSAIESSGLSYMIAFAVITLMMIFLLSSVRLGLISMLPNLFPVFIVLGMMVILDYPLDLFTMLIGAIVIGMAVDDTVHFMHNFRRSHIQGHTTKEAIEETLRGTGRAMTVTSIVLSIGFYVYMFASMSNIVAFGLLTGTAIVAALIADFLLAPALMKLYYRNETKEK